MKSEKISVIIPTWNNLDYLKLCVRSIEENSFSNVQIVIHVNEGSDGTLDWVADKGLEYTISEHNIGICRAVNLAFNKCKNEYITYLNDDMYVCPGWDHELIEVADSLSDGMFMLSGTMIEPRNTGNHCVITTNKFGDELENFNEKLLLEEFNKLPHEDWNGSMWPPVMIHRKTWEVVGGLSEEFSPGMYSDPDLAMKLWKNGVRYFRGISNSRVFHFMQRSTRKIKKNNGRKQFIQKWGVSSSNFTNNTLKIGSSWTGPLDKSKVSPTFSDRLKRILLFT